ncbi:Pimeloyl-ACP methyl ester carboxylesterase [Marivirga sericea]|uniref:Pimeloyl-ACP methyl ester carboxylesterase n=1 Tax=Marivirga sericea TaxID=1028 RepID=A0A1X7IB98_9BACT|nr:alpha/beta hydrolase [Marivirga sericea]SMG11363.1 Pimeloyl-ACP methyl ester carboxylesterase [Marivirga sericea]
MTIKRILILAVFGIGIQSFSFSQSLPVIYLFPGQGSDERLFDSLKFENHTKIVHIKYPIPEKGSSVKDYAHRISSQIDTSRQYIFIGVSLGGMIISELNDFLSPQQSFIISSAKTRSELPFRYRFQKVIPIYRIVPPKLMLAGAKLLQPIVEPDRNSNKTTFKSMLAAKDPIYMKRTVAMIINWDRKTAKENIIHIHGTKDHTIPLRNVNPTHVIVEGSHMMTLTKPSPINEIIVKYL